MPMNDTIPNLLAIAVMALGAFMATFGKKTVGLVYKWSFPSKDQDAFYKFANTRLGRAYVTSTIILGVLYVLFGFVIIIL